MSIPDRIRLQRTPMKVLNEWAKTYHYMHSAITPRAMPFGYKIFWDGQDMIGDDPVGFIIFTSIHFTKQRGLFGYEGLPTKWQVLHFSRLWINDALPKNSESVVIGKCLSPTGNHRISLVGVDWLKWHNPPFPDDPYHIRVVISYSDLTHGHPGYIYRATNFVEGPIGKGTTKYKDYKRMWEGHRLQQFRKFLPEPRKCFIDDVLSGKCDYVYEGVTV